MPLERFKLEGPAPLQAATQRASLDGEPGEEEDLIDLRPTLFDNRFLATPSAERFEAAGIPTPEEQSDVNLSLLSEFTNVPENALAGLLAGALVAATGVGLPLVAGAALIGFAAKPLIKRVGIGALRAAKDFVFNGIPELTSFLGKRGLQSLRSLSTSELKAQARKVQDIGGAGSILPTSNRIKPNDIPGKKIIDDLNLTEIKMRIGIDTRDIADLKALEDVVDFNFFDIMDGKSFAKNVINNPKLTVKQKLAAKYLRDKLAADRAVIITNLRDFARPKVTAALTKAVRKVIPGVTPTDAAINSKLKELVPDDWGIENYLPHLFPGEHLIYDVKTGVQIGGQYNTILDAKVGIMELAKDGLIKNPDDIIIKSKSFLDPESFIGLSSKQTRMLRGIEEGSTISKKEIERSISGNLTPTARLKWWQSLQTRTGAQGFSTDMQAVLKIYNRGFVRFIELSKLAGRVEPLIARVRGEGRINLGNELESILKGLWGHVPDTSRLFDATLAKIPLVQDMVSNRTLDRWTRHIHGGFITAYLKFSPRFQALNAMQTFQTLWPIVSNKEFYRGLRALSSKQGTSILKEFGVDVLAKGGKLWNVTKGIGPAENFNQKLAFLTMFEKGIGQGLTRRAAADYALLRGNLYTQFLGLMTDVPKAFRTAGGLPSKLKSSVFMFKRFPIKDLKIMADLLRDKNFVGAGKWMGAHLLLGGMGFLTKPFGIATGVGGLVMYNMIKEKYGKATADFINNGAPGLIGLDMSGSIQLIDPPFGNTLTEKAGNLVLGPVGSFVNSGIMAAMDTTSIHPTAAKRVFETMIARVPALKMLKGLQRLWTQDYNFADPKGRLKFDGDIWDVLAQAGAFRSLKESRQQELISAYRDIVRDRNSALNKVAGALTTVVLKGGLPVAAMYQPVIDWNALWPEFPITGSDIVTRREARFKSATTPRDMLTIETGPKIFRGRFKQIREQQQATAQPAKPVGPPRFRVE